MKNDAFFAKWKWFGGKLYRYSNGRWHESSKYWFDWELARQEEEQRRKKQNFIADCLFAATLIGTILFFVCL